MRIGHFSFKSGRLLLWNQAFNNQFLGLMNGIGKQCMLSDVTWECGQEKLRGKEREQRKHKGSGRRGVGKGSPQSLAQGCCQCIPSTLEGEDQRP